MIEDLLVIYLGVAASACVGALIPMSKPKYAEVPMPLLAAIGAALAALWPVWVLAACLAAVAMVLRFGVGVVRNLNRGEFRR